MGSSAGSAPAPVDPYTQANAASQYAQQTAQFNANLNRYNVNTPYGSQSWSYSPGGGGNSGATSSGAPPRTPIGVFNGPTAFGLGPNSGGSRPGAPSGYTYGGAGGAGGGSSGGGAAGANPGGWTQNITLSPAQQAILDQQNQQNIGLGQIGNQYVDQIKQTAGQAAPDFNTSRQQAQDALYANNTQYLDPQFSKEQERLQSQLANQGVVPGTEAYDNAMQDFNSAKNQAYAGARNSAISGASGQQSQNIGNWAALQNQPINALNSLRGATQVQTPNFQTPGSINAQQPDVNSAFNNYYNNQMGIYNANVASANSDNQGLYQLGGSMAAAALMYMSDARMKHDAKRVGTLPSGIPVYEFKYHGSDTPQIGVIAQEVEEFIPNAVVRGDDGYLRVDYSKVR